MAEFASRIGLGVKDPAIFERFLDFQFGDYGFCVDIQDVLRNRPDPHILVLASGANIHDLERLIDAIVALLGKDILLAADNICYDVDPATACWYYLGKKVKSACFDIRMGKRCFLYKVVDISNLRSWFHLAGFRLSSEEQAYQESFFQYIYGWLPEEPPQRDIPFVQIKHANQTITLPIKEETQHILTVAGARPLQQYHALQENLDGSYDLKLSQITKDDYSDMLPSVEMKADPYFEQQIEMVWETLYWIGLYLHSKRNYVGFRKLVVAKLLPSGIICKEDMDRIPDADQFVAEGLHLLLEQLQLIPQRIRMLAGILGSEKSYGTVEQEVLPTPMRSRPLLDMRLRCHRLFPASNITAAITCTVNADFSTNAVCRRQTVSFVCGNIRIRCTAFPNTDGEYVLRPGAKALTQYRCLSKKPDGYHVAIPEALQIQEGAFTVTSHEGNPGKVKSFFQYLHLMQQYLRSDDTEKLELLPELLRLEYSCLGRLLLVADRRRMEDYPDYMEAALDELFQCLDYYAQLSPPDTGLVSEVLRRAKKKKNGRLWKRESQRCVISCGDDPNIGISRIHLRFNNINDTAMEMRLYLRSSGQVNAHLSSPGVWLDGIRLPLPAKKPIAKGKEPDNGILFGGQTLEHSLDPEVVALFESCQCVSNTDGGYRIRIPQNKVKFHTKDRVVEIIADDLVTVLTEIWASIVAQGCVFEYKSFLRAREHWRCCNTAPFVIAQLQKEQEEQGLVRLSTSKSVLLFALLIDRIEQMLEQFVWNAPHKSDGSLLLARTQYESMDHFAAYPGKLLSIKALSVDRAQIRIIPIW